MTSKSAFDRLTDYLARRDHSRFELRQKLTKAQYSKEEIETAIHRAEANHWLPNESELALREATRMLEQGKSPMQVRLWLKKKGLPIDSLSEELSALFEQNEGLGAYRTAQKAWRRQRHLAERQYSRIQGASPSQDFQSVEYFLKTRIERLLISRGFHLNVCRRVFSRLLKENPLE